MTQPPTVHPVPDPAARLTAAATHLRTLLAALGGATWVADHHPEGTVVRRANSTLSLFQLHADGRKAAGTPCVSPAIGAYIAAMGPQVGKKVAAWLDSAAFDAQMIGVDPEALAVADAILGASQ